MQRAGEQSFGEFVWQKYHRTDSNKLGQIGTTLTYFFSKYDFCEEQRKRDFLIVALSVVSSS